MKNKPVLKSQPYCVYLSMAAVALLLLLAMAGAARAVSVTNVIYMDTFARSGQLVGTAPDTVNAPGAVWCGEYPTNGLVTDGTEASITNQEAVIPPYENAFLPINLETGHVYVVTCTIVGNTNATGDLAFGYGILPGLYTGPENNANWGIDWVAVNSSNNGCSYWSYGGIRNDSISYPWTRSMTYSTVLNLVTNYAGGLTNMTGFFYTNGVFAYQAPYVASGRQTEHGMYPGFVFLGMESTLAAGSFQNFSVTDIVPNATVPTILEQPNSLTAQVGHSATFWVRAYALPDPTYQWMTNGTAIPGATNATYTTPALSTAYNQMQYSVECLTAAGSVTSSSATLTVNAGTPTVYSATKTTSLTNIVVNFSGPVDWSTTLNPGNYSLQINGAPAGVSIVGVSYGSSSNNVVLQTSTLDTNAVYYLAVQNVEDQFGDAMKTSTNAVLPSGLVFYLRGDSGVELDANGNVAQWLDQTTNGNNASQFFGMYPNLNGTFLSSVTTRPGVGTIGVGNTPAVNFNSGNDDYLTIPASEQMNLNGNLTIYCFGDPGNTAAQEVFCEDNGNIANAFELQLTATTLSPDLLFGDGNNYATFSSAQTGSSVSQAAHVWMITSQLVGTNNSTTSPNITNSVNTYIDGQPYGVGGGDNIAAGATLGAEFSGRPIYIGGRIDHGAFWNGEMGELMLFNRPLSASDRTIVDNYLGQKYFSFQVVSNLPASVTTSNGFEVTYTIFANQGSLHFTYQWQVNGVNIQGATNEAYTTPPLGPANSNTVYDVVLTSPNGTTWTSSSSTLTVLPEPPYVTSSGLALWEAPSPTNIVLVFDVAVDPATGTTATNYTLNTGSVLSAAIGDAPNKVVLTTTPLTWNANTNFYTLGVQNVQDMYGDIIVPVTLGLGLYPATGLWLDATNGLTLDPENSSYVGVASWNDWSGNGNNFTDGYSGAPSEPVLTTNAFGYPVIRFTGTNGTQMFSENIPNASLGITGDMSVFVVMTFANLVGGTNGEIISKTGEDITKNENIAAPYDYYYTATNAGLLYRGNGTSTTAGIGYGGVASSGPLLQGYPQLVGANEAGNTMTHYINENNAGSGILGNGYQESADVDGGNSVYIGERMDSHNFLNGDIAEMIVFDQALDSNEVLLVENYLARKYRVPTGTNTYVMITQQPFASTNLSQDESFSVSAAAAGTPQIGYQWYDTNNVLQAGQTNATLTISNIQASDSYYLVATNPFNSATSSVVTVTVISGLNVGLGPRNVYLYTGQPFTFTALASGTVPFYYQWNQNGSAIANATNASYTAIASLAGATYSCTVTNPYQGYSSTNAGPVTLTGIAAPATLYQATVMSNNPIAYWRLNEAEQGGGDAGVTAYDYAGGHNGAYTNVVLGLAGLGLNSTDTAALFGTYWPSNSYMGEANNSAGGFSPVSFATPAGNDGEFSVEAWVCSSNAVQTQGAGIVAKGYGNGGEQFDLDVYNGFRFFVRDASGGTHSANLSTAPVVGKWYHVVGVFDGANGAVHLYTNGVDALDTTGFAGKLGVLGSTTTNTLLPQANLVSIGARASSETVSNYDLQFVGKIQDVALYNYALSKAQVVADYQATGQAININPTKIAAAFTNGVLYLTWPADHIGWQLQAQTNSVSVGISTNWVNYNPSTGADQVAVPLNLANGTVFFRLIYAP